MCCELFTNSTIYDRWVVPHQLLPFLLTMYGVEYRTVLLLIYVWETFEVFAMHCLELFAIEDITDTLISDPVQGLLGVMAACLLLRNDNINTILNIPFDIRNIYHIFEFMLLSSPSLLLLDQVYDVNLHWFYPALLTGVIIMLCKLNDKSWHDYNIVFLNINTLSLLVFAFSSFNSFYIGLIWGISVLVFVIIF